MGFVRFAEFLLLIALLVLLGFGAYMFLDYFPTGTGHYHPYVSNFSGAINGAESYDASNEIVQFYPNMRYRDRNISYRLESTCAQNKWESIKRAFELISEKTSLSFYYSNTNAEIRVMCSEIAPEADEKGHFIAGEGGPSEIINTSNYAVILSGKISLYRNERCDEPKVATHEILHALGFDHYNNSRSILYPTTGCEQEIDQEIIDDINRLYKKDSLPDLMIESIIANRTGRYLNFNINISNEGLANSTGGKLEVYAGDARIANFTIGDLGIGAKKMMFVENVRLQGDYSLITFSALSGEKELTLENNKAEIRIE